MDLYTVPQPMKRPDYVFYHTPTTDELRQRAVRAAHGFHKRGDFISERLRLRVLVKIKRGHFALIVEQELRFCFCFKADVHRRAESIIDGRFRVLRVQRRGEGIAFGHLVAGLHKSRGAVFKPQRRRHAPPRIAFSSAAAHADDLRVRAGADIGVLYVNGADDTTWQYFKSVGTEWDTSFSALA